jgi:DNA replication protein DnaD
VTKFGILKSGPLPPNISAQLAELVVLTEALKLSKEQRVNIYIDFKYAFLILRAHAAIWKERGMPTTTKVTSHWDKREVTLVTLTEVSYVIANHVTAKNLTK